MNNKSVKSKTVLPSLLVIFLLAGCGPAEEEDPHAGVIDGEGIAVEGPWVRPGSEGRMSAGYFLITNFDAEADTLTGVTSDIAELIEIHESYEREESMMGMRHIESVVLPPQSTLRFEPAGLHLMFIRLNQNLIEGDEIQVTLHFSSGEDIVLTLPVRN